jgi:hypothetical protein
MSKPRVYNKDGMNPKGDPEDPARCIEEVLNWNKWHMIQCSRKRGYGPNGEYCKQHAKMLQRRMPIINLQEEMRMET